MSDWNDRRIAAEAAAMEAMEDFAGACVGLRRAVGADSKARADRGSKLDRQRRFVWSRVNDALDHARVWLGWDMEPSDPLLVPSEATRKLYAEVYGRSVAVPGGREVETARNRMLRAAGAAEVALQRLAVIYSEQLSSPRIAPDSAGPLDRMRELLQAAAGPWG